VDVVTAADELYGLTPEEFTAARTRLAAEAKQAGDASLAKAIGGLRRPTVSAWAVNRLVRAAPPELDDLLDLGERLRSAWAAGEHVTGLDQRRGELITTLLRTVASLAATAGRPLREPASREAEETLYAATMDEAVAADLRTGHLSHPRRHVGFAPAGLAPQPPADGPVPTKSAATTGEREDRRKREEERRRREREDRARAAAAEAAAADRALAEWRAELDEVRRDCATVTGQADRLRAELHDVLARQDSLTRRLAIAEREHTRAAHRATEAHRLSGEARREAGGAAV
jgi:hypothetical protein